MIRENKSLKDSFELISQVNIAASYEVTVGKAKGHVYMGRVLNLNYTEGHYAFSVTTKIRKGVQSEKELEVNRKTEIQFKNSGLTLYTKGKNFLYNNVSYPGFEDSSGESSEKLIQGEINSLSTKRASFYDKDHYYRAILPINKRVRLIDDFSGNGFGIDGRDIFDRLVPIKVNECNYHLYVYTNKNKESFFIVDGLDKQVIDVFQRIVNSILLSFAFLKGDYHGQQCYVLSYTSLFFQKPSSILSVVLGGGIYNGFPVHTTMPLSLLQMQSKIKYKKDADGKIIGLDTQNIAKYRVPFPNECFSKLCELIFNKGGVLRAVILFVNNHTASLEMKIPTLFVALENITKVLVADDTKVFKLIEDDSIIKEIKSAIKPVLKELTVIEGKFRPKDLNAIEEKEYKAAYARIATKFHDFNKGTNNKKLIEPFINFGFKLTPEEEQLIFVYRNKFLHGDDFMTMEESYEIEFKELFHISMRLHKLISVLLLKASGYSGYILNNAKIHEQISQRKLKESVFIKI